jgi:type I restriction enzyme, S subunit
MNFTGRTISNEGVKSSSTVILPINSLLVCTRATIGYCAINTVPMSTNQGFKNLIPNKQYLVDYLYYKILLEKHQLVRLASGSTFLEISKKDFELIEFDIPSLPEQQKIASVLSAADTEISNLEKQLAAYKQQKRGLMQQLLTGKTRVRVN